MLKCQKWPRKLEQRVKGYSLHVDLPPTLDHLKRESLGFCASGQPWLP